MIEINRLSKRYGALLAVDDISFSVEPGQVLDERRSPGRDQADNRVARAGTPGQVGDVRVGAVAAEAGGEERAEQRAGDARPAQLLAHDRGVGQPEADAAVCLGEREGEHAHPTEGAPQVAVDGPGHVDDRPPGLGGHPVGEEPAQLALERDLVVAQLEVHGGRHLSLGRPSIRSPTMLRWICAVPAAIDSDSA